jgi:hypothetical protein
MSKSQDADDTTTFLSTSYVSVEITRHGDRHDDEVMIRFL